jgi:hypothetical protein
MLLKKSLAFGDEAGVIPFMDEDGDRPCRPA